MVIGIEARLSPTVKSLEGQRKDLAVLRFSATEGSDHQERVLRSPGGRALRVLRSPGGRALRVLLAAPTVGDQDEPGPAAEMLAEATRGLGALPMVAPPGDPDAVLLNLDVTEPDVVVILLQPDPLRRANDDVPVGIANASNGSPARTWERAAVLTRALRKAKLPVIAVSMGASVAALAACVEQGATGLFYPESLAPELARIANGSPLPKNSGKAHVPGHLPAPYDALVHLTRSERRVLFQLMEGRLAAEIASSQFVSVTTVRSHIRAILSKLNVNSQLAAVALAFGTTLDQSADVTQSVRAREELQARATFDAVTQCCNRQSTISALEEMLAADEDRGGPATIFVGLDRFSDINDSFGHAAGDDFLRVIAERLQRGVRGEDVVGRIGGDEFLVLCPGICSPVDAMRTASRLAHALRNPIHLKRVLVPSRASIGLAWSDAPGTTSQKLVSQADAAMYASKRAGVGEPVLFDESMPGAEDTHPGHSPALSETGS